jgi:transcriptional regulator with XRE-family HTH domain
MKREELLGSKEFWLGNVQDELFRLMEDYLNENNLTRSQFADQLGVTKGYVSQILNGDFNHRISKLVELSLAIGKVPLINFYDLEKFIEEDKLSNKECGERIDKPDKTNGSPVDSLNVDLSKMTK